MIIELMRAHTPEEVGHEEVCAICAQQFRTDVVLVNASTEDKTIMGNVCPACVGTLGAYRPDKFPTLEEYETATRRFQGPIWENAKEATAAWRKGAPHHAALAASRIERA